MAVRKESVHKQPNSNVNPERREQVIYIGPDENITEVRERLNHTRAKAIALVIPAQTRLRSHVAWRLLKQRAFELDKDVSIVSSDGQILSLARSVQLKTATSL
jgi:hypothetical protein